MELIIFSLLSTFSLSDMYVTRILDSSTSRPPTTHFPWKNFYKNNQSANKIRLS